MWSSKFVLLSNADRNNTMQQLQQYIIANNQQIDSISIDEWAKARTKQILAVIR